ncbi:MAG: hypothetical protein WD898_01580 [Candidatus Paceibacterota bacterium]
MNDSPLKNYWFWVLLIIVVGIVFFSLKIDLPANDTEQNGDKQARLVIYFDSGARAFEGEPNGEMTVLEALYAAATNGNFDVRYRVMDDGDIDLYSIENFVHNNHGSDREWRFYLDGNLIDSTDIGRTEIEKGDLIEIKYEVK